MERGFRGWQKLSNTSLAKKRENSRENRNHFASNCFKFQVDQHEAPDFCSMNTLWHPKEEQMNQISVTLLADAKLDLSFMPTTELQKAISANRYFQKHCRAILAASEK